MLKDAIPETLTQAPARLIDSGVIVDGRYEIIEPLGEGGSGSVFKARELELDRIVTVKILQESIYAEKETEARFLREGKILSSLSHPNIVTFYRFGKWNDKGYIAMEYLDGETLESSIINTGQLPVDRVLLLGVQLCEAMSAAHCAGVVHRDLKPANIMLLSTLHKLASAASTAATSAASTQATCATAAAPAHTTAEVCATRQSVQHDIETSSPEIGSSGAAETSPITSPEELVPALLHDSIAAMPHQEYGHFKTMSSAAAPNNTPASDTTERVKILDFGISYRVTPEGSVSQHLTQTGAVIGSLAYMSPEQCTGKKVDHRTDVYSLACILYEAMCGERPFACESAIGLLHKHVSEPPVSLNERLKGDQSNGTMVRALDAVIFKGLSKDPDDRYQSMDELKDDLQLILSGHSSDIAAAPVTQNRKKHSRKWVYFFLMLPIIIIPVLHKSMTRESSSAGMQKTTSKSSLISRKFPHRYEFEATPMANRIDYCRRWLQKYEKSNVMQAASAHCLLAESLFRQDGTASPETVGHAQAAIDGFAHELKLWKAKRKELDSRDLHEIIISVSFLASICEKEVDPAPLLMEILEHKDRVSFWVTSQTLECLWLHYRWRNRKEEQMWLNEFINYVSAHRTADECQGIGLCQAITELASLQRINGNETEAARLLTKAVHELRLFDATAGAQSEPITDHVVPQLVRELIEATRVKEALSVAEIGTERAPERSSVRAIFQLQEAEIRLTMEPNEANKRTYFERLRWCESDYDRWKSLEQVCSLPESIISRDNLINIANVEFGKNHMHTIPYYATHVAITCVERQIRPEFVKSILDHVVRKTMNSTPEEFSSLLYASANACKIFIQSNRMQEGTRFVNYVVDRTSDPASDTINSGEKMVALLGIGSTLAVEHPAEAIPVLRKCETMARRNLPHSVYELAQSLCIHAQALLKTGHRAEATALAKEAISIGKTHQDDNRFADILKIDTDFTNWRQESAEDPGRLKAGTARMAGTKAAKHSKYGLHRW